MEKPFAPDLKGDLAEEGEADSREADGWHTPFRRMGHGGGNGVDGEGDGSDVGDDKG